MPASRKHTNGVWCAAQRPRTPATLGDLVESSGIHIDEVLWQGDEIRIATHRERDPDHPGLERRLGDRDVLAIFIDDFYTLEQELTP